MAGMEQSQVWCRRCKAYTLAARPGTSHVLHLLLTVLTLGLWLPVWVLCAVKVGGWRCQQCGGGGLARKLVSAISLIGLVTVSLLLARAWGFI